MGSLNGKAAVVAGATSGIGARTAELFAAEGASVVIAGRRKDEGEALAARLGPRALFVRTDVAVEAEVEHLVDAAVEAFGRLDVMVNNAGHGGSPPGSLREANLEVFLDILAVHAGGVLTGMKHAARVMVPQGSGSVVNMASISGHQAGWSGHDYSASKAAIIQLTRTGAVELGPHGIRVNSISPGPIPTGVFGKTAGLDPAYSDRTAEQLAPMFAEAMGSYQSVGRAGRPQDVAAVALWLAGDGSAFVTGQDIVIDGGITAGRPVSVSLAERTLLAEAFAALH